MTKRHTVAEVIEVLNTLYKPDDQILIMWWDKTLPYLGYKEISNTVWEKTLDLLDEGELDLPSGIIWDTIAEKLVEIAEKEDGEQA